MAKCGIYIESWYKEKCPYCESINWICNGNEQDSSGPDYESCKCYKCKSLFWLDENAKPFDEEYPDIEESMFRNGREKPS